MTGALLMSTTLPTIIGMGVVSQSMTTMFGSGTGKRVTAARAHAGMRKIDGKWYKPTNWHTNKSAADKDAAMFRKAGHSARVVKSYNKRLKLNGYRIYVR